MRGLFVTGTDTGVGKTAITGALARALRERGLSVGVAKPVQSGALADDPSGDAMLLREAADVDDPPDEICPYAFRAPLAPLVAARLEGRVVEPAIVLDALGALATRHDLLLVEGAGGLLVPVGEDWTIADLAAWTGLPLLIVARAGLGTVNHTLLTLSAARQRGLEPVGVVLNGVGPDTDESWRTNSELIAGFGDVPVIGIVPWLEEERSDLPGALSRYLELDPLLRALDQEEARRA